MRSKISNWLPSVLILLLTTAILTSCGPKDSEISSEVNKTITAYGPNVSATVEKGVVTLIGEVNDESSKTALEASVKGIKGVKSVVNNTTVKPAPAPEPTVTINPDDVLKTTIENSFTQKGITGVSFAIADGVVTLTGKVKKDDLMKVMQAVNEAKPRKVVNQLTIVK
ncbi:BON domain-containing protein [Solitalea canadensis]|uniref:Putative periplasmic or secreted lipoprotein n=1 Tax=Solitalea canadensis (strain ATCC 29591 / DSM 3403 / JCM 21819 / LMG 8368 / NBRC 15130 / NCIMB 12057 / USAM 9D) TaxID=929556 RepID=H8KSF9_SOLCM|nr:BON domain-containing protein [Solitalea canadensis]AFD08067.1 putative periplasmic or secreted lipoprotein [Solitalea canadensis DSM 3403]